MIKVSLTNKGQELSFIPCSKNKIILQEKIKCPKCLQDPDKRRRSKQFTNCRSLFYHLVCAHNGSDENLSPSKLNCIEELQRMSDGITMKVKNYKNTQFYINENQSSLIGAQSYARLIKALPTFNSKRGNIV